ncbi:MAG: cytochrome b/b6 domain-containing protein [Candidatus Microbacterium colombiense]|nr:MAG: cytochrome b/b6 domain-containing protein [Microbacterium sp.]
MTTRMLRRGLPRVAGGDLWPPSVEGADAVVGAAAVVDVAASVSVAVSEPVPAVEPSQIDASVVTAVVAPTHAGSGIRRGLPRVPGGEAWPPAGSVLAAASSVTPAASAPASASSAPAVASAIPTTAPAAAPVSAPASAPTAASAAASDTAGVRRGLPRRAGGEPWPPAGTVPAQAGHLSAAASDLEVLSPVALASTDPAADLAVVAPRTSVLATDIDTPLPWARTVWNGRAPRRIGEAPASARRRPTWTQAIAALMGAAALGVLAGAAIAFVRTLLSVPVMQDFLTAFPGAYEPAIAVAPGFAPWVGWQHFFNVFLMVLIIRSGLRVRSEKRPTVFWAPRHNPKGKISLTLWFHQALDILWLVNGVVFVVLLIVTGHWVRIVPTSWEVFPNALSAALQYVSFDWPTEHGWVNYNSLQQLAYFTTVFIAAPLAAITGFRMSGLWPKKAERLSKAYPVEWARALHFPVMLYFVVFIIGHVALVFLTGFLRNLNHMYASSDAVGWTGFWVFVASLVVIAGGWFAARPLVLAPIAKTFGNVSGR